MTGPRLLTVALGDACSSHCRHCDRWRARPPRVLDAGALARALGDYQPEWTRLTGGEPFLRADLDDVVSRLGGHRLAICTNLLTPRWPDVKGWIEAHVHLLAVSLDTVDASVYRHFRGEAMGDLLLRLRSLGPWLERKGHDVVLSSVLTPDTLGGIEEVGRFAAGEGFALVVATRHGADRDFVLGDASRLEAALAGLRAVPGLRLFNRDDHLDGIAPWATRGELPVGWRCEAGRDELIVEPDLSARLCYALPPVGDLRRQSVSAVWTGKRAMNQRARIAARDCPGCWLPCHHEGRAARLGSA